MKPPSVPKERNFRLLVEGKDDQHSIIHLLRRHKIDYDTPESIYPYIHSSEGCAELLGAISVSIKTYQKLGILIDADTAVSERWNIVKSKLIDAGVTPPESLPEIGLVTAGPSPNSRVGVWIMPDNITPGTLEDFLSTLVPSEDRCWPLANRATEEAQSLGARFRVQNFSKARIHAWLAWQEEPGQPFGTALTAAYFRHDSDSAIKFVNWFKRLFLT